VTATATVAGAIADPATEDRVSVDPATVDRFAGLVLLCDDRFAEPIGAHCGGPAEATVTPDAGGSSWGPLLDRFEAAPGRFVSVYGPRP